jgi:hypothetical protein
MVPSLYVVRSHGAVHSHAMLTNFRQHRFNLITMLPQDTYILYTKLVSVFNGFVTNYSSVTSQLFCTFRLCSPSLVVNVKEVSVLFDF